MTLDRTTTAAAPPVVSLISLGCAKNEVDSERILGALVSDGFLVAEDPQDADLCLVNTCGFIGDAREETRATLEALARLRRRGAPRAVAALGCMVEQARRVPAQAGMLSAADLLIPFADYPRLPALCRRALGLDGGEPAAPTDTPFPDLPRARTGFPHTAYLKISEGCSNRCRFCTIPAIRGPQVSRPIEALAREAAELAATGARELVLVAQDSTGYGRDLYGEPRLVALLETLEAVEGIDWIRLMYAFPPHLSDDVLRRMAASEVLCPYLDLPLQHIADGVLNRMGRPGREETLRLLDRIEALFPAAALRTTFIVGYPGESEREFEELRSFVRERRFLHAGVFPYSREVNTPAGREPDDVPAAEKARRADALMEAQADASRHLLADWVGQTIEVLVDGPAGDGRTLGRTSFQAPAVDGVTQLETPLAPGELVTATVTGSGVYDLEARVGRKENAAKG
jgi:ribosomal protein S12 methylthiotransferase